MRRRDLMLFLPAALSLAAWREQKASTTDGELSGERAFQRTLPRSSDPLWVKLRQCKVHYNAKTALYSLTPTDEVKALIGQTLKVRGFIIPLDGLDLTKHFLIGINTPVCLFHPPGEPNEVIEVRSLKAVAWNDKPLTIEGQFKLISNPEMGVFFAMTNAKPVKAQELREKGKPATAIPFDRLNRSGYSETVEALTEALNYQFFRIFST